jgi:hypothetical protein
MKQILQLSHEGTQHVMARSILIHDTVKASGLSKHKARKLYRTDVHTPGHPVTAVVLWMAIEETYVCGRLMLHLPAENIRCL